jgi:hypothetical protein
MAAFVSDLNCSQSVFKVALMVARLVLSFEDSAVSSAERSPLIEESVA